MAQGLAVEIGEALEAATAPVELMKSDPATRMPANRFTRLDPMTILLARGMARPRRLMKTFGPN
jgi:hypothetical protein